MGEQTWYLRIGEQRGRRRLWVEGARLLRAGVQPGQPMRVDFDDDAQLVRIKVGEGARRVSQRKRGDKIYPVIDISNDSLAEIFGDEVGRVRVVGANGELEVSIHPDEASEKDRLGRGRRAFSRQRPVRVGSLFHGGGVLDHAVISGLEDAGLPARLAWAVEADARYLDASVRNNPSWANGGRAIEGRVEEVHRDDLSEVDLLIAGIPCTGASLAGRAKNGLKAAEHHETAGSLFVATLQAIQASRPAVVLIENVPPYANTLSMHVIRDVLGTWGYELHETILNGLEHGALEDRNRLAVVAVTRGLDFSLDWIRPIQTRAARLAEVLDPVGPDDERWRSFDYLVRKERADRAAGKGFRMQVLTPDADRVGTLGRGYAKGRSTEPRLAHPARDGLMRQFTPAEHARLKGVPESLIDGLSLTLAHEILGQSVIFPAFRSMGRAIAKSFGHVLKGVPSPANRATPPATIARSVRRETVSPGSQLSLLG
jgi:DNA (cytosine-5)-methyltransferase 1